MILLNAFLTSNYIHPNNCVIHCTTSACEASCHVFPEATKTWGQGAWQGMRQLENTEEHFFSAQGQRLIWKWEILWSTDATVIFLNYAYQVFYFPNCSNDRAIERFL